MMLSARNAMRQEENTRGDNNNSGPFSYPIFSFSSLLPSTAYLLYILYPCLMLDL